MVFQLLLSGICALTSLPGPPSIGFQNGTFQLYPINRRICPNMDPQKDIIFNLYTRDNPNDPQILLTDDVDSVKSSNINFTKPTKIFFHGFFETSESDDAQQIKNCYLKRGDYNIILVNNKRLLAAPYLVTAASNCKPIAQFSARFIDFLVSQGLKLSALHIIGFSLGGQIAGLTGKYVTSGKVARITGLDPAGPFFVDKDQSERIGPDDAEFVDIVHTSAGWFGINLQCGKVDIWVNGGSKQPGCSFIEVAKRNPGSIVEQLSCSHYQAYRVFVQASCDPRSYLVTKCSSYEDYKEGKCSEEDKTYLGEDIDQSSRGNYYSTTGITAVNI